jgi:hypothetical protein
MNAGYKLFLDDIRNPTDAFHYTNKPIYSENNGWVIVRDYASFKKVILQYFDEYGLLPQLISFDHDLADEHYSNAMYEDPEKYNGYYENKFVEKTGYDCAKWLVEFCIEQELTLPHYMVHSMNPIGGENINMYLKNFLKHQDSL